MSLVLSSYDAQGRVSRVAPAVVRVKRVLRGIAVGVLQQCSVSDAYCNVYGPDSIEACCSEFRFNRLNIILTCDLTSANSDSA